MKKRKRLGGEHLTEKQRAVINAYQDQEKLSKVIDWPARMLTSRIKWRAVAEAAGVHPPRVSEWVNFKSEPSDERFEKVEAYLASLGA